MAHPVDQTAVMDFLVPLLNIPSPTGYHEQAVDYCQAAFNKINVDLHAAPKGMLVGRVLGETTTAPVGITAHLDTLGAMVSRIKSNGRLEMTQLGGWAWGSVEGEGVVIHADNTEYTGTILPVKASVHIYGGEARDYKRASSAYEVRIDARTASEKETRDLGIEVGDFISFEPHVMVTDTGFIRSRHLDNKAGVACIYGALKAIQEAGKQPSRDVIVHISHYEEVGHGGAAGFPPEMEELLTIDMAAAGGPQNSDEFSVGICVKDAGGPYHIGIRRQLISLAKAADIPHKPDVYPYYGSDGEAYWRAGGDVRVGLIGPGVDASHHYERTHIDSIVATTQLIIEYLLA